MPLETFGNIDDLVPANPDDDDLVLEGAAHLRGIKESLQGNVTGDDTETRLMADGVRTLIVRRPGVDDPLLAFRNALDDDDLALLAYDAVTDTLRVVSLAGAVVLEHAGLRALSTEDFGATLFRDALSPRLEFSDGTDVIAEVASDLTGFMRVASLVDTRGVQLLGQTSGAPVTLLEAAPGGNLRLFDVGVEVFRTSSAGANVVRPGAATPTLGFNNDGGVIAQINANDAGPLVIHAFRTSRGIEIRGTNSADATIVGLSHDPNAGVFIRGADNVNHLTINNDGINVNGQAIVSAAAPLTASQLTRKDYVDGRSQGNIAQRQIVVNGVMLLAGIQTAVGQSISVTYATPFSGATPVVQITLNAAAGTNVFGFITNSTLTGFTATVGLANAGVHWMAQGAL